MPEDIAPHRALVDAELTGYAERYGAYFSENAARYAKPLTRLDRLPRVLLSPGLGALTVGKTLSLARIAGDVYLHTATTISDAMAVGRYAPANHSDLFDVEYWSLEQAKLKSAKSAAGPLARRIALVTGAARGIGHATAKHFLTLGAHVLLSDSDHEALSKTRIELEKNFGTRVASAARRRHPPGGLRAAGGQR
ncbi:MAG TPA: SDR family NAD(P)-dependent oxidoreductase, partial [Polyangiaceae bacterium]